MTTPYYSDDTVTLYHGDCREILPLFTSAQQFACVIADPPYGETSLEWDRWPDGWPALIAEHASSMWCFGSLRMYLARRDEFALWRLSQDVVMRKELCTSFTRDRFRRRHELPAHWYRGAWSGLYHDVPLLPHDGPLQTRRAKGRKSAGVHGAAGNRAYLDSGLRLATSVLDSPSPRRLGGAGGRALHPTEKPASFVDLLIRYACPPGGTVLDPFAGSGSTAVAARMSGRRAVLIEADERYCEAIANRLQQDVLPIGGTA